MGSGQSVRATHFQNPGPGESEDVEDDIVDDHHISISNKMVERLVEDATLAGGAAAVASGPPAPPRGDYKDQIYMEKLKFMDDNHSERCGLTVNDVKSTVARIEIRTANMFSPDPVCKECREQVIDCYISAETPSDVVKCWDTIGAFKKCVQDEAAIRLRTRTQKEAREHARRSRHVAHAREHALKDLNTPLP